MHTLRSLSSNHFRRRISFWYCQSFLCRDTFRGKKSINGKGILCTRYPRVGAKDNIIEDTDEADKVPLLLPYDMSRHKLEQFEIKNTKFRMNKLEQNL